MTRVTNVDQIWEVQPTLEERCHGARYAAVSLFWTYDRMKQENRQTQSKRNRAFNISKGLAGQRALQRELSDRDIDIEVEEKSHRETDTFDIRFPSQSEFNDIDIKTFNHFTDYGVDEKPALTPELIADNFDYDGSEWGHLFPMLVPYDQISQNKDIYCFGISSSIDYRNQTSGREGYELYAYPDTANSVGEFLVKNIESREKAGKSFTVHLQFVGANPPEGEQIKVIGELDGDINEEWITVGSRKETVGPLAGVNSFKIRENTYRKLEQQNTKIAVGLASNNTDSEPNGPPLTFTHEDFHNLLMPTDFTIYFLGWISKSEFKQRATDHPGWKQPSDDFKRNQRWRNLSNSDKWFLNKNGLDWTISQEGEIRGALRQNAGCYYYPKINRNNLQYGGLQRTNLYVLPEDLRPMDEL